ncbi:MAG: prepilin-type N-terminal cleavage/methylation domain-containing protein [Bacilli bacterium]|nr:prepilin-type N-terminal cleavage/methylation domain-containing protein [Bacilli bacterium]
MNKKGFTLIEILAVIVILGVIMVIAVPFVTGYIERSKRNALLSTADGFIDSVVLYHSSNVEESDKVFIFDATRNGETTDGEKIDFKGKFTGTGSVRLYQDGKTAICISDGKYFALKNINDTEIKTGEGLCSYDEATNNYSSIELVSKEQVDELQAQIDQLNSEKQELVSTLISNGVSVNPDSSLADVNNYILSNGVGKKIYTLGAGTSFNLKTNYATYGLSSTAYTELTSNDFYVTITRSYATFSSGNQLGGGETTYANVVKTYNNTTGILTITGAAISDSYDQTNYGGGANQLATYLIR